MDIKPTIEKQIRELVPLIISGLTEDVLSQKQLHICFIFKGKTMLSYSTNRPTYTDRTKFFSYVDSDNSLRPVGVHAEFNTIMRNSCLYQDMSQFELVVIRISREKSNNNNYVFANSKPCSGCSSLLSKCNFKRVWFSTNQNSFVSLT